MLKDDFTNKTHRLMAKAGFDFCKATASPLTGGVVCGTFYKHAELQSRTDDCYAAVFVTASDRDLTAMTTTDDVDRLAKNRVNAVIALWNTNVTAYPSDLAV